MFKLIFRIIKWAITSALVLALILYPIVVLKVNPISFYFEKFKLLWEAIKDFPLRETINSIKSIRG